MNPSDILSLRLHHQRLTQARARRPQQVVSHLVAMQAQEFAMAKWAIALRMAAPVKDADIQRAFDAGRVLRTHVLRPTWHFVAPADIRWLLKLTAPRVHAASAYMYRQLGLDGRLFARADGILERALRDEPFLTRAALQECLAANGVKAHGPRLAYLVMHAELEGLLCSGPRIGRQFTYALLDSRVGRTRARAPDDALAELSRRYFETRGPASAQDFASWSGLTLTEARAGLESLGRRFERVVIAGRTYAFKPARAKPAEGVTFLMPDYDEYGMSYQDRGALFPDGTIRGPHAFNRMIIVDGRIVGSWRRVFKGRSVNVQTDLRVRLPRVQRARVADAIRRFSAFAPPE